MKWSEYRKHRDVLSEVENPMGGSASPSAGGGLDNIHALYQKGREVKQQRAQNDQNFEQRVYLFDTLASLIPEIRANNRAYRQSPEAASQLYNQLGRSQGILNLIKQKPEVLDRILTSWLKMALQGDAINP